MDSFLAVLVIASAAAGSSSALMAVWGWWRGARDAKERLKKTEEDAFDIVLKSDSISEVGGYLYEGAGAFALNDYSSSPKVRQRVTRLLERLESFLGGPEIESSTGFEYESHDLSELPDPTPTPPNDLLAAQRELPEGEVWNGLARIRRIIELHLRDIAQKHGVASEKAGAGQLLRTLKERGIIPTDAEHHLQYAISVANKGVHGVDVPLNDAAEAFEHAAYGLARIESRP